MEVDVDEAKKAVLSNLDQQLANNITHLMDDEYGFNCTVVVTEIPNT